MTKPPKYLRPSLREVQMGCILRFVPSQKKQMCFSPTEIMAMYGYALQEILDLSDEGVRNVQAQARWLDRHNKKKGAV
jgi:hypothetical protein